MLYLSCLLLFAILQTINFVLLKSLITKHEMGEPSGGGWDLGDVQEVIPLVWMCMINVTAVTK